MNKIPSFTINHEKLLRGIYVSRKDEVGNEVVTTFDIRMKEPNREPASRRHFPQKRRGVERPRDLLGADGLPDGQLSLAPW